MTTLKKDHWIHVWHYQFVNYHLCFSFSCFLRCHLSECFASARAAIDATLSSYYCLHEPEGAEHYKQFIEGVTTKVNFRNMKRHISRVRDKEPTKFPLAERLIQFHDQFSEMGAHADPQTIHAYRTAFHESADGKGGQFQFDYFQVPPSRREFIIWYAILLNVFYHVLQVFKLFLDRNLRTVDPVWERDYDGFMQSLKTLLASEKITPEELMKTLDKLRSDQSTS
jgi:hypothetical protein